MPFTSFELSAFITSILSFFLGVFVYLDNKKSSLNRLWAQTSFFVSLWALGLFGVITAPTEKIALIWQYLLDASAIFIPVSFLHFVYYFTFPELKKNYHKKIIAFYTLALLMVIFSFTPYFKIGVHSILSFNYWINPGKLYFLFPVYFSLVFIFAIYLLIKSYFRAKGVKKLQLVYIILAVLVGLAGGSTNFLPQLIGKAPVGNYLVVFYIFFVVYAITRHHFLNVKVIASELFVGAISLALLINIFSETLRVSQLFASLLFAIVSTLGYFLVASVKSEVKAKEAVERLAKKLEKANIELRQADKAKTEFLSMASHQLRTPLTAIKGYISLALEGYYGQLPEKLKKALFNVYQSNERLVKIVHDLLTISRIEMGKLEIKKEPTDIVKLVHSCIEELKLEAQKKNLKLYFEKPKAKIPFLNIDSLKIRQAVLNFIDNAIKYTEKGEIKVKIEKEEDKVKIIVSDTGVGFEPEEAKQLFESFSRGTAGISMFIEGTGLGLNVAKRFVELHQGKITAFSEGKGKGSVFTIILPTGETRKRGTG